MTKRVRETVLIVLTVILIVGLSYFSYRHSPRTANTLIFATLELNVLLLLLVAFLVIRNVGKLILERRKGMLGSRIRTKMVGAFITLTIIPTVVLFIASLIFLTRSMEGWLSAEVTKVFEQSKNVADIYYIEASEDAIHYANFIAGEITEGRLLREDNLAILKGLLNERMNLFRISAVEVFSAQGEELIKIVSPKIRTATLPSPESRLVKNAMAGKPISLIVRSGKADVIEGIVPIRSSFNQDDIVGVLVVDYFIPESLSGRLGIIRTTFDDYIGAINYKRHFKIWYVVLLTMTMLLVIFIAVWFALKISRGLTTPIESLLSGTQRISKGDLGFEIEANSNDELGLLGKAFNAMVGDLRHSRQSLETAYNELAYRNRYIETVLNNISTGVISINSDDRISMINPPAQLMLGIKVEKVLGQPYLKVLKDEHFPMVNELIDSLLESKNGSTQRQVVIPLGSEELTLMVHASMLKDRSGEYLGLVVVFDDLTQLQKMQRMAAWREVARRIAHEIKNPLTPIQLSAQRLRRRYLEKLEDAEVFDECTRVIISQVEEMKHLVDEFSAFAKMPTSRLVPDDLNEVVSDSVVLYRQAHPDIEFVVEAAEDLPRLDLDRSQLSRAIGNLLENAANAVHELSEDGKRITARTLYDAQLRIASLEIADTGPGIPTSVKKRIFEPYFSTKKGKGGTGLGLSIVNRIVTDHGGFVRVRDNQPRGSVFTIELPAKE